VNLIQALVLGALQGATEFLPVSSSGHLVLVPWLMGWENPGILFDTTVHLGTLVAVLTYFRHDLTGLLIAWFRSLSSRDRSDDQARLAWLLVVGTIPAVILGYLLEGFFERLFGRPLWVSALLVLTGLMLALSERLGKRRRRLESLGWHNALIIGLAQACAIAPGISRSGATIAGGLSQGLTREEAARFSFLLSAPVILGTGIFKLIGALSVGIPSGQWAVLLLGFVVSALSGYLFIRFLLAYVRHHRLYPFAIYCACVGMVGASIALSGAI
jgi:undecaprenyl-diphosphatase